MFRIPIMSAPISTLLLFFPLVMDDDPVQFIWRLSGWALYPLDTIATLSIVSVSPSMTACRISSLRTWAYACSTIGNGRICSTSLRTLSKRSSRKVYTVFLEIGIIDLYILCKFYWIWSAKVDLPPQSLEIIIVWFNGSASLPHPSYLPF